MKHNVEVPQVGESISEGILAVWFVEDGAAVAEGDQLFELETDKATMSIPAPAAGVIAIQTPADTEVSVGMVVATIDSEATAAETKETPNRNKTNVITNSLPFIQTPF